MNKELKIQIVVTQPLAVILVFFWIGLVTAISFIEAWLKFQAPGVTIPIGLGIGQLVFGVLNKIECLLAVIICVIILLDYHSFKLTTKLLFAAAIIILGLQTIWLLPALDIRTNALLNGEALNPSNQHCYYIFLEIVKVILLVMFGILLFKKRNFK